VQAGEVMGGYTMHHLYWLLILLLPLALSVINLNHWRFLRKVLHKHNLYMKGAGDDAQRTAQDASNAAADWIMGHLTEIRRSIESSGVSIPNKVYLENLGHGREVARTADVLDNLLFPDEEVILQARRTIEVAKGHYMNQAILWLNPIHWVEVVIFLPKEILHSAGFRETSKVISLMSKIATLVYWIIGIVGLIYFWPKSPI
jgi:hypothetical protein